MAHTILALSATLFYLLSDEIILTRLCSELESHMPSPDAVVPTAVENLPFLISIPIQKKAFANIGNSKLTFLSQSCRRRRPTIGTRDLRALTKNPTRTTPLQAIALH